MIVSVVYLVFCRLLELVVLLGRRERSKELEILVLRQELSILRRRIKQPQFKPPDRLLLAALSRVLPRRSWSTFLVRPETLLHWHRRLVARQWTSPRRKPGRPPMNGEVRGLILRIARDNPSWGYLRIVGELRRLDITVSATSVRNVLVKAGLPPAPQRDRQSWRSFLQAHGESILACDFFTVDTIWLRRLYVLAFLSIASRRIEYVVCTSKPNTDWMLQQARNLLMELDDRDQPVRFLIHDRDAKFPKAFDALLEGEQIKVIRTPVQAPNANAHMERWVGSVRRECLDRLLIVGHRQLAHVLHVYVRHYNRTRPHRALDLRPPNYGASPPLRSVTTPHPQQIKRHDLLGGLIHELRTRGRMRSSFCTPRAATAERTPSKPGSRATTPKTFSGVERQVSTASPAGHLIVSTAARSATTALMAVRLRVQLGAGFGAHRRPDLAPLTGGDGPESSPLTPAEATPDTRRRQPGLCPARIRSREPSARPRLARP